MEDLPLEPPKVDLEAKRQLAARKRAYKAAEKERKKKEKEEAAAVAEKPKKKRVRKNVTESPQRLSGSSGYVVVKLEPQEEVIEIDPFEGVEEPEPIESLPPPPPKHAERPAAAKSILPHMELRDGLHQLLLQVDPYYRWKVAGVCAVAAGAFGYLNALKIVLALRQASI